MEILKVLEGCLTSIPKELVEGDTFYVELDKESYKIFEVEVSLKGDATISSKEKVTDFGKCTILNFMGHKVIVSVNDKVGKLDTCYVAFKTKI